MCNGNSQAARLGNSERQDSASRRSAASRMGSVGPLKETTGTPPGLKYSALCSPEASRSARSERSDVSSLGPGANRNTAAGPGPGFMMPRPSVWDPSSPASCDNNHAAGAASSSNGATPASAMGTTRARRSSSGSSTSAAPNANTGTNQLS